MKLYLVQRDVYWQEKHVEILPLCFWVWWSEEQQNLAADSIRPQPFNYIPDQAKVREVRDIYNHVSVSNLQRLQDAHPIISDVDDRQQAIR